MGTSFMFLHALCVKTTVMKGLVGLKGGLKKQNKTPKTKKNKKQQEDTQNKNHLTPPH